MEENKEVQQNEEKSEDQVQEQTPVEEKADDRPEENYKAELARKNAQLEALRVQLASRPQPEPARRDPNDMNTWAEHELKAVLHTQDPQYAQAREQASEILLDRKVEAKLVRRQEVEKKVNADLALKSQYPEALNPTSELAIKMEQLMGEYDLSKTPAGRLVAAKMAQAELEKGRSTSDARGRKMESDRRRDVKSNMVDGDRPKPADLPSKDLGKKRDELADALMDSKHEERQIDAVDQILRDRGLSRDKFFGKR